MDCPDADATAACTFLPTYKQHDGRQGELHRHMLLACRTAGCQAEWGADLLQLLASRLQAVAGDVAGLRRTVWTVIFVQQVSELLSAGTRLLQKARTLVSSILQAQAQLVESHTFAMTTHEDGALV